MDSECDYEYSDIPAYAKDVNEPDFETIEANSKNSTLKAERNWLPILFRGDFFEIVERGERLKIKAKCNICGPDHRGKPRIYQGTEDTSSNFISHLKRMHRSAYERYLITKNEKNENVLQTSLAQNNTKIDISLAQSSSNVGYDEFAEINGSEYASDEQNENKTKSSFSSSILFVGGFFNIIERSEKTKIKAKCVICGTNRSGKPRIYQGSEEITSNFITHLKRMHSSAYEKYLTLKSGNKFEQLESGEENRCDADKGQNRSVPILFRGEFFEIIEKVEELIYEAICAICKEIFQGNSSYTSSNCVTHLKRGHHSEYEKYLILTEQQHIKIEENSNFSTQSESEYDSRFTSSPPIDKPIEFVEMDKSKIENFETDTTNADIDDNDGKKTRLPMIFQGEFFEIVEKDDIKVKAKCVICDRNGGSHLYQGTEEITSNFITHLKRRHKLAYEKYLIRKSEVKKDRAHSSFSQPKKEIDTILNQDEFDEIVIKFIINSMQSLDIVEDESFVTLLNDIATHKCQTKISKMSYKMMSQQTLKAKIDKSFVTQKQKIKQILQNIPNVCITADIWSRKHKSYMAVAVHWIDVKTLERNSAALSCKRFFSPFTNEKITKYLDLINLEYEIGEKTIATVTDNGSNVEKIFRDFGIQQFKQRKDYNGDQCNIEPYSDDDDQSKDNQITYVEINYLPKRIRCATRIFNLIGTEDVAEALKSVEYSKLHKSTFEKLNQLWNYLNSIKFAEKIEKCLGSALHRPDVSRWNSLYDCLVNLLDRNIDQLNDAFLKLEIPKFTATDIKFLEEYVKVLEPIASALEYLQKDECYYATYLPIVYSTKENLIQVKNNRIELCLPLLTAVLHGFENRFAVLFDLNDEQCAPALIATCTHPFFKLRWLKGELKTETNINKIQNILMQAAKQCDIKCNNAEKTSDAITVSSKVKEPPLKKFKFQFDTAPNDTIDKQTTIQMDIMSFLKRPCGEDEDDLEQLQQHHCIQELFIKYNSIIPSSASVEKLFAFTELLNRKERQNLKDELFEKLSILKANSNHMNE